jgi:hypothetical protein
MNWEGYEQKISSKSLVMAAGQKPYFKMSRTPKKSV